MLAVNPHQEMLRRAKFTRGRQRLVVEFPSQELAGPDCEEIRIRADLLNLPWNRNIAISKQICYYRFNMSILFHRKIHPKTGKHVFASEPVYSLPEIAVTISSAKSLLEAMISVNPPQLGLGLFEEDSAKMKRYIEDTITMTCYHEALHAAADFHLQTRGAIIIFDPDFKEGGTFVFKYRPLGERTPEEHVSITLGPAAAGLTLSRADILLFESLTSICEIDERRCEEIFRETQLRVTENMNAIKD